MALSISLELHRNSMWIFPISWPDFCSQLSYKKLFNSYFRIKYGRWNIDHKSDAHAY